MPSDAAHATSADAGVQARFRGDDAQVRTTTTSPLLRRIFTIYLILALAVFAFPGGLVSWLDDRNASGWLDAPLAVMRGVDAASAAMGVKQIGQRLRKGFAAALGDEEG